MVIDELYILRTFDRPDKANSPLIVHPDRVLSLPISLESLQPISRWSPEIAQRGRGIQITWFAASDGEQTGWKAFRGNALECRASPIILEALDHIDQCIML
jgi:hypothetical protein